MAEDSGNIKARFEIKKIRSHNSENGFTIAEAKFTKYESNYLPTLELVVVGNFISVFEGDEFEAEGKWVNHDVFGYQFQVEFPKRIVPQSRKGMIEFICRHVRGVGKKTAEKIVNKFGEQALSKIEEDWRNLLQVGGISEKRAKRIHDRLTKYKRFEEIAMFVLSFGGGYKTALRVYEAFGESAIMKIRENPYVLCSIKKVGFPVADVFAKNMGFSHHHIERIKEAVLYLLDWCSKSRGDLYVSSNEIKSVLSKFLYHHGAFKGTTEDEYRLDPNEIDRAIAELKKQERIVIEINDSGEECVYLRNFNFIENRIVALLKRHIEATKPLIFTKAQIQSFLDWYEKSKGIKLADQQKAAVYMALTNGFSIMTGGPGTGKTQTINAIIQCVKYYKPDAVIHLFAPTGKASKRMSELTGMEAMTIHRGIGLGYDEEERTIHIVEGDLLVVDETSMMDAYVCYKLLSSVTENTRILFVGDYEQLPSVGPGLILRDFIQSGKIPTTKLTEIFRQKKSKESQIVLNAHKVLQGNIYGITFDEDKGDFYFIERKNRLDVQRTIITCVERLIKNSGYTLDDIQILSPMKKGDLGVWALNRLMQETFNPRRKGIREIKVDETMVFREGDKVIHTVNNKDLDVYNGEIGKIISIFEDDEGEVQVEVEYDEGKRVIYNELTLEEIELAYVSTVHKSQGSEYPVIIMPIHSSQEKMLSKTLIFTGWTRAKEKVIMIGTKSTLYKGLSKNENIVRNSNIKEKIIKEIHYPISA